MINPEATNQKSDTNLKRAQCVYETTGRKRKADPSNRKSNDQAKDWHRAQCVCEATDRKRKTDPSNGKSNDQAK